MKNIKFLLIPSLILLLAGCGTITPGEPREVTQPVYSYNPGTGQIIQTGTTNLVTSVDVWTPNTNLVAALGAAQGVAAIGAATPSPVQPLFAGLAAALAAASAGLEILRRKKNNELTTQGAALAAVITAIETAENAGLIKTAVQKNAVTNGSQAYLDSKVQAIYKELP